MRSPARSVEEYLGSLPADRRVALAAVRNVVLDSLPAGYEEGVQYGMITYFVPFSRLPETYNGQPLGYISLGSQKHHLALYLMGVYGDERIKRRLREGFEKAGKRLDMGKSCLRFKQLDDLPLDVIGEIVAAVPIDEFIKQYEQSRRRQTEKGSKTID
jgi:Domain of unknown function (DU1801)